MEVNTLDEFFEEMLEELLGWRWDSAGSQEQVANTERKWRDKWAEAKGPLLSQRN